MDELNKLPLPMWAIITITIVVGLLLMCCCICCVCIGCMRLSAKHETYNMRPSAKRYERQEAFADFPMSLTYSDEPMSGYAGVIIVPTKKKIFRKCDTSTTHLQKLLQEYSKLTRNFTKEELIGRIFQLPFIAISYFTDEGGSLSLEKYNVHLYIPRGVIPQGGSQQVYIYVNPNAPPVVGIRHPDVVLSPMIQCGPPGLKFLDSVVLSFPHHAQSEWELSVQMCSDDDNAPQSWHPIDGEVDGILVSSTGNKAIILLNHFTGVAVVGQVSSSSCKMVQIGAFGAPFDPFENWYSFRVHVWNDDEVAKQNVLEIENQLASKLLDAYRCTDLFFNGGDLTVKVCNLKDGWEMDAKTLKTQVIPKSKLWSFPSSSVTFDFTPEKSSTASYLTLAGNFRCDVFSYQLTCETEGERTENNVRLSIRPKYQVETNGPSKPETSCRPCQCLKGAASDFCSACKQTMANAFAEKVHGSMNGDFGGLTTNTLHEICELLDIERDGGTNWIQLAERLTNTGHIRIEKACTTLKHPTKEVLKIYFSLCRENQSTDEEAVDYLKGVFKSLHIDEAVQVLSNNNQTTH